MGWEMCRSGSFPGGCSSPTIHRAGLHGHGCKLQLLEEAQPELFSQEGGCKCASPGALAGRGWGGGTWCTSGHTTSSSSFHQGGTSDWGEGRECVLGETGDREGHGVSTPQTGCLPLPSPRDRSWLCMGLTGAPSLAAPPACPHCCKAQHLSQPFPSHREKGKAPGELSEKPSEPLALLISSSRFTRCSGHKMSVSSLWPPWQSISNSTSHGAAHPGCPPAPEMSSGRQMPNDA